MRPEARSERLLLEEVGNELVIYDLQRHRAHQLNRTAALVWQSCDGHKTIAELRKLLQTELDPGIDDSIVWQALERLGKAHLLREPPPRRDSTARITRRQALRKFGQTAALALLVPAVTSIYAPAPLAAGTFTCNSPPCSNACRNLCTTDANCPPGNPVCRLLTCSNPNCGGVGCMQRRCTKQTTPH
jgi:hypothetical protein